jgi:hypothetical protein
MLAAFHKLCSLCSVLHSSRLVSNLSLIDPIGGHLVSHALDEIIHDLAEVSLELLERLIDLLALLYGVLDLLPEDQAPLDGLCSPRTGLLQLPHQLLVLVFFPHGGDHRVLQFLLFFIVRPLRHLGRLP